MCACGLFLLDALIGTAISVALPSMLIEQGQSSAQIGTAFGLIGIVRSLLHAALWAAVLFAIFSGRAASGKAIIHCTSGFSRFCYFRPRGESSR